MRKIYNISALLMLALSGSTFSHADEFSSCVLKLQQQARTEGISPSVVDQVLGSVKYVPRVIELDRRQPEFTETFANYLNNRVTASRVSAGRALLAKHQKQLSQLTQQYGVPAQYLIAFWGLETNYGSYLGKMPILDSLATLACDQRRSRFFTKELFEALRLIEIHQIEHQAMLGSWAGAMGHTQFMPSAYRTYAIDGDGNGHTDLWNSVPDALASAANFLHGLGWQKNRRWGREVKLPENFSFENVGTEKRPLSQWAAMGVSTTTGAPLAELDIEAALLVPAGHKGPAFLVYKNFDVIMRWNRSYFYAISVGYLADRIKGAGVLHVAPPTDAPRLDVGRIRQLQEKLNALGFDAGEADGVLGSGTRQAIRAFQQANKLVADGYPDTLVFNALGLGSELAH